MLMNCPECAAETVTFPVPDALRDHATAVTDERATGLAICTHCLRVWPDESPEETPTGSAVNRAFPPDSEATVALALAFSLLDSLAANRQAVEELIERAERAGVDPLTTVERVTADPEIEPAIDLPRRYRQFEQLRS